MQDLRAEAIVKSLLTAGVTIAPTDDGRLRVSPASRLTPELCGMIRETKAELLKYFSVLAANDPELEPQANPNAWKELAQAYHEHHFNCPTCIAAGRGRRYGKRCGAGMALWRAYCD
jgi:hypothetical protein